jgi:excinuclease ABC subunit C
LCTLDEYGRAVDQTRLLLEGRQDELIARLHEEMRAAAVDERYERAAHLRDAIRTIETIRDRMNKIETPTETGDRDAFGIKVGPAGGIVQVFQVRRGKVVDRTELVTERDTGGPPPDLSDADARALLSAAIQEFYEDREPPAEIHLPFELDADDAEALQQWLRSKGGQGRLVVPRRGDKRALVDLVSRNAATAYQAHFRVGEVSGFDALDTLRAGLALPTLPRRIECFDISTLQGRETVAAMVVCIDGRMRRGEYRKFRIRGMTPTVVPEAPAPDDFAAMEEVVLRRYQRLLAAGGPFPDLILIDGGKGQLTAAYAALRNLGLERLVAIGIAKEEELIFTRDRVDGLALPRESAALRLIQRIRDEAHRFAITFHRQARRRRDLRSALDDVAGIGPRRRKQLLTAFGSVAGVRRASRAELEAVVGAKAAEAVIRHFAESA